MAPGGNSLEAALTACATVGNFIDRPRKRPFAFVTFHRFLSLFRPAPAADGADALKPTSGLFAMRLRFATLAFVLIALALPAGAQTWSDGDARHP
jgi:hypothetical protein